MEILEEEELEEPLELPEEAPVPLEEPPATVLLDPPTAVLLEAPAVLLLLAWTTAAVAKAATRVLNCIFGVVVSKVS